MINMKNNINLRLGVSVLFCLLLTKYTKAQFAIGIAGGYTKNYLNSNLGYAPFSAYKPVSAFTVGIPVQYQLMDWLALQTDLSYIRKSYKVERSDYYTGIYQTTANSYLKLPLMAHVTVGSEQFKGFLNVGGYMAYWMSSRIQGVQITGQSRDVDSYPDFYLNVIDQYYAYQYKENAPLNAQRDRRMELGLLAGIGLSYQFNSHYRLFTEARYYYAVTDMQKNYMINQIPRYNNTYVIQAGILFNLQNLNL